MEAKVKEDSRYRAVTAFSGLEFIKGEWRSVPVGREAEAKRNQYLEVREVAPVVAETKAEEAEQAAPKKARGKQ